MPWYVDTSGLMKLCVQEPESLALSQFVEGLELVVSELAVTELLRGVRRASEMIEPAQALLERIALVAIDREILVRAAGLQPATLRTLDAIHLATAQALGESCEGVLTYDHRMQAAARAAGFTVAAPGQP